MCLTRPFAIACLLLLATSCASTGSSRYSCGVPEGQPCRSALDVYADTDSVADAVIPTSRKNTLASADDHWQLDQRADGELVLVAEPPLPLPTVRTPMPVRTEARILRIWIAPFENADGDLVAGSHLYTEIEPRRWRYGQPALPDQPSLKRLPDPSGGPSAPPQAAVSTE